MARTAKARERPANYPKLTDYQPTCFMLPDSHYDAAKADRAVRFIENLCHTKGRWAGKPFWLLPWQEQIIRDIFGVVKEDDTRQFRTAYVEIPKKNGKRDLSIRIHSGVTRSRRRISEMSCMPRTATSHSGSIRRAATSSPLRRSTQ